MPATIDTTAGTVTYHAQSTVRLGVECGQNGF
jgi:hypothetical protein